MLPTWRNALSGSGTDSASPATTSNRSPEGRRERGSTWIAITRRAPSRERLRKAAVPGADLDDQLVRPARRGRGRRRLRGAYCEGSSVRARGASAAHDARGLPRKTTVKMPITQIVPPSTNEPVRAPTGSTPAIRARRAQDRLRTLLPRAAETSRCACRAHARGRSPAIAPSVAGADAPRRCQSPSPEEQHSQLRWRLKPRAIDDRNRREELCEVVSSSNCSGRTSRSRARPSARARAELGQRRATSTRWKTSSSTARSNHSSLKGSDSARASLRPTPPAARAAPGEHLGRGVDTPDPRRGRSAELRGESPGAAADVEDAPAAEVALSASIASRCWCPALSRRGAAGRSAARAAEVRGETTARR